MTRRRMAGILEHAPRSAALERRWKMVSGDLVEHPRARHQELHEPRFLKQSGGHWSWGPLVAESQDRLGIKLAGSFSLPQLDG